MQHAERPEEIVNQIRCGSRSPYHRSLAGPSRFRCRVRCLFISNMVTLSVPKTFASLSSASGESVQTRFYRMDAPEAWPPSASVLEDDIRERKRAGLAQTDPRGGRWAAEHRMNVGSAILVRPPLPSRIASTASSMSCRGRDPERSGSHMSLAPEV